MKKMALITVLTMSINANAQLTVITDTGNTVELQQFTSCLDKYMGKRNKQNIKATLKPVNDFMALLYPAKSNLRPGIVATQRIDTPHLLTPIFIVGDDELSRVWLQKNKEMLMKTHAFGIVTNVEDENTVKELEDDSGLTLTPSSLQGIEDLVPITHYPLLWDKEGIRQ